MTQAKTQQLNPTSDDVIVPTNINPTDLVIVREREVSTYNSVGRRNST